MDKVQRFHAFAQAIQGLQPGQMIGPVRGGTGFQLVQLIETSNICGHFANASRAAYLDIFSCKQFDPGVAAAFCIETFQAAKASGIFLNRE